MKSDHVQDYLIGNPYHKPAKKPRVSDVHPRRDLEMLPISMRSRDTHGQCSPRVGTQQAAPHVADGYYEASRGMIDGFSKAVAIRHTVSQFAGQAFLEAPNSDREPCRGADPLTTVLFAKRGFN